VDLRPVKQNLKPIFNEVSKRMPLAQRQASTGLQALQNLLDEPDFVSASQADANLSAIKKIVREADSPYLRNVSQGLAAKTSRQLDLAIRAAVAKAGPEATAALDQGRGYARSTSHYHLIVGQRVGQRPKMNAGLRA
jgi:hypothetical protein